MLGLEMPKLPKRLCLRHISGTKYCISNSNYRFLIEILS